MDETEKQLAALVTDGQIFAKIDRPAGIVSFAPKVIIFVFMWRSLVCVQVQMLSSRSLNSFRFAISLNR